MGFWCVKHPKNGRFFGEKSRNCTSFRAFGRSRRIFSAKRSWEDFFMQTLVLQQENHSVSKGLKRDTWSNWFVALSLLSTWEFPGMPPVWDTSQLSPWIQPQERFWMEITQSTPEHPQWCWNKWSVWDRWSGLGRKSSFWLNFFLFFLPHLTNEERTHICRDSQKNKAQNESLNEKTQKGWGKPRQED